MSENELLRYSVSLVTQGRHRFYTLTMPSNILAETCFVTPRSEDPQEGFQRLLDRRRAQQIADYIDNELGTIPNSVVLSAQSAAELKVVGKGKSLEFRKDRKAFLILDGQHRVFGFKLAKTPLRVPVVIYNGLNRKDESRLFIDINTKQRPVPNELLLDIKSLAEYESDTEKLLRNLFDLFNNNLDSPLIGKLSPAEKISGKISRVTFNSAFKPLLSFFPGFDEQKIYNIVSSYFAAFLQAPKHAQLAKSITNPTIFKAFMLLFRVVAQRVQDKYEREYTTDNFSEVLAPVLSRIKPSVFKKPGSSPQKMYDKLEKALKANFTL